MIDHNTLKEISEIPGWLTPEEASFLFHSAAKVPVDQIIVEIGSWKGKSTTALGLGSRGGFGAKVLAIDPHKGSEEHQQIWGEVDTLAEFKANMTKLDLNDIVTPLVETSQTAAEHVGNNVGLIFIDGAHDYNSVWNDIVTWAPKVVPGGIIAVHDTWHFIGANLASAQYLLTSSQVTNANMVDTITYWQKISNASFLQRLKNISVLIKRPYVGYRGMSRLSKTSEI